MPESGKCSGCRSPAHLDMSFPHQNPLKPVACCAHSIAMSGPFSAGSWPTTIAFFRLVPARGDKHSIYGSIYLSSLSQHDRTCEQAAGWLQSDSESGCESVGVRNGLPAGGTYFLSRHKIVCS